MDIAGAKALKERLAKNGGEAPSPAADVPEDAKPVYQWTGVKPESESARGGSDEVPSDRSVALIRRLVPRLPLDVPSFARLRNAVGEVIVERCEIPESSFGRMRGLLGRQGLEPGTGVHINGAQAR